MYKKCIILTAGYTEFMSNSQWQRDPANTLTHQATSIEQQQQQQQQKKTTTTEKNKKTSPQTVIPSCFTIFRKQITSKIFEEQLTNTSISSVQNLIKNHHQKKKHYYHPSSMVTITKGLATFQSLGLIFPCNGWSLWWTPIHHPWFPSPKRSPGLGL